MACQLLQPSFFFVRFHARFQTETNSQNLSLVRRKIGQYLANLLAELLSVVLCRHLQSNS